MSTADKTTPCSELGGRDPCSPPMVVQSGYAAGLYTFKDDWATFVEPVCAVNADAAEARKGGQIELMLRENLCRVKPDLVGDRPKEQHLMRTATLGVVQLFNAIAERRKHVQTQLSRPELKSEFKRDRVREQLRVEGDAFEAKLQGKSMDDDVDKSKQPKKKKLTKQKWLSDNVADVIKPDSDSD